MPTLTQLTDETLLTLYGYGTPQPRASFLTADITNSTLSIPVTDGTNFEQGIAEIGDELIYVEAVNGDTLTVAPDGRGYFGTTAAAHSEDARVQVNPVFPRTRVQSAINDAIEGTHPVLYGVGTDTFTFNGVVVTFELPADCEQVLQVSADTIGASNIQQPVRRWRFDSTASAEFASGNTLTLEEPVDLGRTVTVTYRKAPTAITANDEFTVSGLRGTATKAVKYAAVSDLLSYLDANRLHVASATASAMDERNGVGDASRVSAQLYQRYEIELERERKRLAATTPVPVNVRIR